MKKLQKNKLLYISMLTIALCFGLAVCTCSNAYADDPVLFFSDLTWGPKTGWEGSATKGAAVTIWGENFRSAASSSKITVNGVDITSTDSTYIAEWNAAGPARELSRITFWVPSSAADGAGTITVTVNGVASNTLPFNVTNGTIYFISATTGSNSNNGLYATAQGGANGPFRDLYMFNPGLDSYHNSTNRNPSGDGQYIAYVRGGTYTAVDVDNAAIAFRGPYGGPTQQKALIGYPGETVTVDTANLSRGVIWFANYDPYGKVGYLTISKINAKNGYAPMGVFGDYNRIVGCTFYDYLLYAQTGLVQVTDSQHTSLFGNYLYHSGNDAMKHGFYIKTEYTGLTSGDRSTLYTDIGWNEFYNFVASDHHGGIIFVSKSGDSQIAQYPTAYTYIHDNYFHNNDMECLYVGDGVAIGDVYFYNNICATGTSSNGGMTFYNGTNNVYIYNNTFYQVAGTSGSEFWATGSTTRLHLMNNIFYATPNNRFVLVEGSTGAQMSSDYDLYYSSTGAAIPSGTGITVTNSRTGNPLFAANGTNFRLQVGSPAINQGVSAVSSIVTKDYDGNARPWGSIYDIGACEYVSGDVPPVTHTVTPSAGSHGSISPSTPYAVVEGATTQLTVTPESGYTATVGGTCGGNLTGTTYTTNAITANCTVSATFSQITHTVTPSAGSHGSISPSTPQTINHGATTQFTVTPDSGYTATVSGTCGGHLSGTTYTTNAITADCTVSAAFILGTKVPSTPTNVGLTL